MNDDRNQPQFSDEELKAFEQQLRGLTPREAAFRLPIANSQHSRLAAMHTPNLPPSRKQRAWVATLIATWTMGAAAGIAGTLLYSRLGTTTPTWPETVSVSPDLTHGIGQSTSSDRRREEAIANRVDSSIPVDAPVKSTSREESQPLGKPSNSSSSTPWSYLISAPPQSARAGEPLTPRGFVADLAFDSFRDDNIRMGSVASGSSKIPAAAASEEPDMTPALSPEKIELSRPINQRDLLRNLLQI